MEYLIQQELYLDALIHGNKQRPSKYQEIEWTGK